MGKGEERTHGAPEVHARHEPSPGEARRVFEQPATLREPAAPRVPQVTPPSAVPVVPLPGEERSRASGTRPATLQEAREATDALIHDILEGDLPADTSQRAPGGRQASPPRGEDWPAELHSLHLPEE